MTLVSDLKRGIGNLLGIKSWMTTDERIQIVGGYACYGWAMYVLLKARDAYKQHRINQRTYMSAVRTALAIALEGVYLEIDGRFREWFWDW